MSLSFSTSQPLFLLSSRRRFLLPFLTSSSSSSSSSKFCIHHFPSRSLTLTFSMPSSPKSQPTVTATTTTSPSSTRALLLSPHDETHLSRAAKLLQHGRLVAFPTETVFGLGACAFNTQAIRSIFQAKQRPSDNPLIVHVSSIEDLEKHDLTSMPLCDIAKRLASNFWPGPLTLILPLSKTSRISSVVTAGLDSIAVRVPCHPVARRLLQLADIPIAAPSANLSGRPSPTCAMHVLNDLGNVIDAVVDEQDNQIQNQTNQQQVGLESTVVDLTCFTTDEKKDTVTPIVLRPGSISVYDLSRVAGVTVCKPTSKSTSTTTTNLKAPKAPGMKYRHYAPVAPLHIVNVNELHRTLSQWHAVVNRVGVLANKKICATLLKKSATVVSVPCGNANDVASFARDLYSALRAFDGEGEHAVHPPVDVILAVPPTSDLDEGIGEAVMNRLRKAAAGRVEGLTTEMNGSST